MASSDIAPSAAPPVVRLIEAFHRLPGIGPKSAQRLTYHLIRMPQEEAEEFAAAILGVKEKVVLCETCANLSESSECVICADLQRDRTRIGVVEEPLDVVAKGLRQIRELSEEKSDLHKISTSRNRTCCD